MQDSGNQGLNRVGQGSGKPRFREPGFGQVLGIVKNRCQEPGEPGGLGKRFAAGSYRTKV